MFSDDDEEEEEEEQDSKAGLIKAGSVSLRVEEMPDSDYVMVESDVHKKEAPKPVEDTNGSIGVPPCDVRMEEGVAGGAERLEGPSLEEQAEAMKVLASIETQKKNNEVSYNFVYDYVKCCH